MEYPERLSRGLIFVKWLLAIPHLLILWVLAVANLAVTVIAFFAILLTGRYPRSLFEFSAGVWRWYANVASYVLLRRDEYPPFSLKRERYPVTFEADYPDEFNRWSPLFKWLLVVPSSFVATALLYGALIALIPAWFIILITGRLPRVIFDLVVRAGRWYTRSYLYAFLMTDEYPPWTMESSPAATRLGWIVAPIGGVLYIALSVASAFMPSSSTATAFDLRIGDCVDYGGAGEVSEVSCARSHDAEVVGISSVPGDTYPGEASLIMLGDEVCSSHADDFLYPLPEGWAAGDRTIVCLQQ